MLQLGSFYSNDEAEPNSKRGWFTHDPRFDSNVGHVQSREWESEFSLIHVLYVLIYYRSQVSRNIQLFTEVNSNTYWNLLKIYITCTI